MLTKADIDFIKETRKEIVAKRTSKIIVTYAGEVERDPISGEPISEGTAERQVDAVVTEISTKYGDGDKVIVGGVVAQEGDIWISIDIEQVAGIARKIQQVKYDGNDYEVLATDKKGIGAVNRVEVLARVIS